MPTALSRAAELATVADFIKSAGGQPSGLVIAGEAGIGKTTVWLDGIEFATAAGFRVLSARAGQAESVLAYATVADLLADVSTEVLDRLPDLQRIAVERILLRHGGETGPETGQWVAAAAFTSLVTDLLDESPVLVAIDDVQWLDSSSRAVVEFATRRLGGRFGVLVTARTERDHSAAAWLRVSRPDGVTTMRVTPMSLGALHEMISKRLGRTFPRPAMVRIAEVSGGNPFYALELARAVPTDSPKPEAVLPPTLVDVMRDRTQHFDDDTHTVLLTAACVADPTVELVGAATTLPPRRVVDLLEKPEREGVVSIDGNRVRFTHPLLARKVYTQASAAQRRRTHRALAEVETQPEIKARHLALGSTSADEDILHALDSAAEVARGRGAPAAAAELIDLARNLGGDTSMRRIRAAGDHFQAGDTDKARSLLTSTLGDLRPGALRAIALLLLAAIRIYDNGFDDAMAHLREALDNAADNPLLRVQALILLSFTHGFSKAWHSSDEPIRIIEQAVELAEQHGSPSQQSQALTHLAMLRFLNGDRLDEVRMQQALELEDFTSDVPAQFRASVIYALLLGLNGRLDEAESRMLRAHQHYLERAAERDLMAIAGYRTMIAMWAGRFDDAAVIANEAMQRSEQLGGNDINVIPLSVRSAAAAYAGREDDARRDAQTALATAERLGYASMTTWPIMTLGFLEVSLGNYAAALEVLAPILFLFEGRHSTDPLNAWALPDAIEALIGAGRIDEAQRLIDTWAAKGRRTDRPWVIALAARGRSLLLGTQGEVDAAIDVAQQALVEHDRLPMPFERARTLLLLGQLQRRKRQKQKAVDSLTEALRTFEELGTPLWAGRARDELSRTNIAAVHSVELTPAEQRVAELAATGMKTRDIAAALFISPKTVEANLGKVYRKLGIRSRAELGRRFEAPPQGNRTTG